MKGMVNFSLAKKEKINSIISDRISNNLVTEEEGYLLDATQGKVLKDEIGNTDISAIGNGTLTGALKTINSNLESKLTANSWRTFYKRNMSGGKLLVLLTDITTWYIGTNIYYVDFTGIVSTNRQHWYGHPARAVAICYCSIGYYGAASEPYLYTTNSNFRPIIVKYTNPEDDTDIKYYLAILRSFKIDSGQNIDMLYSMQVQSGISTGLMTCIPFDSSLTVPDGYEIIKDNNSKFIEASSAITLKGSSGSYSYDNIKTLEDSVELLNTNTNLIADLYPANKVIYKEIYCKIGESITINLEDYLSDIKQIKFTVCLKNEHGSSSAYSFLSLNNFGVWYERGTASTNYATGFYYTRCTYTLPSKLTIGKFAKSGNTTEYELGITINEDNTISVTNNGRWGSYIGLFIMPTIFEQMTHRFD